MFLNKKKETFFSRERVSSSPLLSLFFLASFSLKCFAGRDPAVLYLFRFLPHLFNENIGTVNRADKSKRENAHRLAPAGPRVRRRPPASLLGRRAPRSCCRRRSAGGGGRSFAAAAVGAPGAGGGGCGSHLAVVLFCCGRVERKRRGKEREGKEGNERVFSSRKQKKKNLLFFFTISIGEKESSSFCSSRFLTSRSPFLFFPYP